MGESNLHRFLKLLGMIYLHEHGCREIATEVWVNRPHKSLNPENWEGLDKHFYIDVLGIGKKPILETVATRFDGYKIKHKIGEREVLKGIEAKATRSDFKNGFVCTGINYGYVITPLNLITKPEIPKNIGLLEYVPNQKYSYGIKISKRPLFQDIPDYFIERARKRISERQCSMVMRVVREQVELLKLHGSPRKVSE